MLQHRKSIAKERSLRRTWYGNAWEIRFIIEVVSTAYRRVSASRERRFLRLPVSEKRCSGTLFENTRLSQFCIGNNRDTGSLVPCEETGREIVRVYDTWIWLFGVVIQSPRISLLFVFIDVNDGNNLGMTENESREIKVDILRSWNITASITFSSSSVLVIL